MGREAQLVRCLGISNLCWDTSAGRAAAPNCAMEVPSDDDGASPARSLARIAKRRRRGPASRGDHPLLPSGDDGYTSGTALQLGLMELPSEDRRSYIARSRDPRDVIFAPNAGASLVAGGPRGDHPRGVIPGSSAGDALGAGDIDLPEEVVNDELDDLFVEVTTGYPEKEDSFFRKAPSWKRSPRSCVRGAHPCRCPSHSGAGSSS